MTIVGLDDTDSRERGMCTTYLATRLAERLRDRGDAVERRLLVRLNPAVKHKTRGNAALALHTDCDPATALALAREEIGALAVDADPRTSPGVVVADVPVRAADPEAPTGIPDDAARFARRALRERLALDDALAVIESHGWLHAGYAAEGCAVTGRGRIGALAAVGAPAAFDDWTYEHVSYRAFERCGTPREVDVDSVFAAADEGYPTVWDTVDRGNGSAVCVPNAPGPILYGIRGDDPDACRAVADAIESEPVDRTATFRTNQGTDAHLAPGDLGALRDGAGYRVDCVVAADPATRRGGHVFVPLVHPEDAAVDGPRVAVADDARRVLGAAFEPTGRFRDRVRGLRPGDRLTVCGEFEADTKGVAADTGADAAGTIKLEKVAVRELVTTALATPDCPDCGRSMSSAGRGQGYRCRDCGTDADGKVTVPVARDVEEGWYEVPPAARRHVAKPLVRGGFDAPTHPER